MLSYSLNMRVCHWLRNTCPTKRQCPVSKALYNLKYRGPMRLCGFSSFRRRTYHFVSVVDDNLWKIPKRLQLSTPSYFFKNFFSRQKLKTFWVQSHRPQAWLLRLCELLGRRGQGVQGTTASISFWQNANAPPKRHKAGFVTKRIFNGQCRPKADIFKSQ